MEKLIGKYVVVAVKMPYPMKRPNFYHGKVLNVTNTEITIDDIKLGAIPLKRSDIVGDTPRELNWMDYARLECKFDKATFQVRAQQIDEKIIARFENLKNNVRKMVGG